ncbi:MAG: hypothetical protein LCH39_02250 [Proteobacteria bacterium]|nr:hypothetical protein [Pseudomonadota bacterium]
MTRLPKAMILIGLLLGGCQERVADRSFAPSTPVSGVPVSRLDREHMVAGFNSTTCRKTVWPTDNESNLTSAGLLMSGLSQPVPPGLKARFPGQQPYISEAVEDVYRRSVMRGLSEELISIYFSSRMGKAEVQGNYAVRLAQACGLPDSEVRALSNLWGSATEQCGPMPSAFVCKSNPTLSEKR